MFISTSLLPGLQSPSALFLIALRLSHNNQRADINWMEERWQEGRQHWRQCSILIIIVVVIIVATYFMLLSSYLHRASLTYRYFIVQLMHIYKTRRYN